MEWQTALLSSRLVEVWILLIVVLLLLLLLLLVYWLVATQMLVVVPCQSSHCPIMVILVSPHHLVIAVMGTTTP
jgi:uncharacterized integral membrane protein